MMNKPYIFIDNLNLELPQHAVHAEEFVSRLIIKKLDQLKNSSGKLRNFFGVVNRYVDRKNIAVCGGAVRDWVLGKDPKDVDFILDSSEEVIEMLSRNFPYKRSQFNGYMFDVGGVKIDMWRLQDSWIFLQNPTIEKNWENLLKSFPFNIDCVFVFGDGRVMERGFFDGMNRRRIELINPINKDPSINIVQRAIKFRDKYEFSIGTELQNEINKQEFSLDRFLSTSTILGSSN